MSISIQELAVRELGPEVLEPKGYFQTLKSIMMTKLMIRLVRLGYYDRFLR
jgi:hypothetical protein